MTSNTATPTAATIFPYDSYNTGQKTLIDKTRECITKGDNLFVHAPTGIGKTISIITAAMDAKKKLFYIVPRSTQLKNVFREVNLINSSLGNKTIIKCVGLTARAGLCKNIKLIKEIKKKTKKKTTPKDFSNICVENRSRCPFYNLDELDAFSKLDVVDPGVVRDEAKKSCPYEICKALISDADVVVLDYNYFVSEDVRHVFFNPKREAINPFKDCVLFFDEAHNIHDRIRNMYSHDLTQRVLDGALKEAKKYGGKESIKIVEELIHYFDEISARIRIVGKMSCPLVKDDFKTLTQKEYGALMSVRDKVYRDAKHSHINSVLGFERMWFLDDYLMFKKGVREELGNLMYHSGIVKEDKIRLNARLLDVRAFYDSLRRGGEMPDSLILASGTLQPINYYRKGLAIPGDGIILDYPFPLSNRLVVCDMAISCKYPNRNTHLYRDISNRLTKLINATPLKKNILVAFPSYEFKENVIDYLINHCRAFRHATEHRNVFIEVGTTKDKKKEMYDNFVASDSSILFAVNRGSFTEGMDYEQGRKLSTVIQVGVPYPKTGDFLTALHKHYEHILKKPYMARLFTQTYPATIDTAQTTGRVIRSPTDEGVIILMDSRFIVGDGSKDSSIYKTMYKTYYPDLVATHDINEIGKRIKSFWRNGDGGNKK